MPRIRNPVRDVVRNNVYDPLVGPYGAPFSPLDLPNVEWFDASDPAFITLNVTDVQRISDKAGGSAFFDQLTGTRQPLYGLNKVNGLNALDFSGGSTESLNGSGFAVFPVTGSVVVIGQARSATTNAILGWSAGPAIHIHARSTTGGWRWTDPTVAFSGTNYLNTSIIIVVFNDATSMDWFVNGAESTGNLDPNDAYQSASFTIGNSGSGAAVVFDGFVCEVIRCDNHIFTPDERAEIFNYGAAKWGAVLT